MDAEPNHTMGLLLYLTFMNAMAIGFTIFLPPWRCQTVDLAEGSEQAQTLIEKPEEPLIKVKQYKVTHDKFIQATETRNKVETSMSVEIELNHHQNEEREKVIKVERPIPSVVPQPESSLPIPHHSKTPETSCHRNIAQKRVDEVGHNLITGISSSLTSDIISEFDVKFVSKLEKVNEKIAKALRLEKSLDSHTAKLTEVVESVVCPTIERVKNIVTNVTATSPVKKLTPKNAFCCSLQEIYTKFDIDNKSKGESWNRRPVHSYQSSAFRYWQKKRRISFKRFDKIHRIKRSKDVNGSLDKHIRFNPHVTSTDETNTPGVSELVSPQIEGIRQKRSHHSISSGELPESDEDSSEDDSFHERPRIPLQCSGSSITAFYYPTAEATQLLPIQHDYSLKTEQNGEVLPEGMDSKNVVTDSKAVLERIPLHLVSSCSLEHFCEIISKIFEAWSDTQLQLSVDLNKRFPSYDCNTITAIDNSQISGIHVIESLSSSENALHLQHSEQLDKNNSIPDYFKSEDKNQYEKVMFIREILNAIVLKMRTAALENNTAHAGNTLDVCVDESQKNEMRDDNEQQCVTDNKILASGFVQESSHIIHTLSQITNDVTNNYINADFCSGTIEPPTVQVIKSKDSSCWRKCHSSSEDAFYECEVPKSVHHDDMYLTGSSKTSVDSSDICKQLQLTSRRVQSEGGSRNWPIDIQDERTPVITDSSMISASNILSVHSLWPNSSYSLTCEGNSIGVNQSYTNSSEWSGTISLVVSDEESSSDWTSVSSSSSKASSSSKRKKWTARFIQKLKRKRYKSVETPGSIIEVPHAQSEQNLKRPNTFKHNFSKSDHN